MLNLNSMAKAASRRRDSLQSRISSTREDLAAMEKELEVLDGILKAIPSTGLARGTGRPRGRKGGKWRPGRPGRPPQWYIDQQKGKVQKPAKQATKAKKKRKASAKQLAAMAKAREALAKKRAAAK